MYSVCINGSVSQLLCMHGYKLLQLISEPHVTVEETVSEFPRFEPLEFSQSVTQLVWMSRIIGKKTLKPVRKSSHSLSHSTPPALKGRGRCWSPSQLPRGQCRHFITGPHRKTNNHCKQPRTHTSGQFRLPSSPHMHVMGQWEEVGGPERKPMQAHGEHANFAQTVS